MVKLDFYSKWPEYVFIVLMLVGLIVALASPSAFISYIVVFFSGMIAGRVFYFRRNKLKAAYYIIIFGFLVGFLIGSVYGEKTIVILLFVLGAVFGYQLFERKILKDTIY